MEISSGVGQTQDAPSRHSRSGDWSCRGYWRRKVNTFDVECLAAGTFRPRTITLRPRNVSSLSGEPNHDPGGGWVGSTHLSPPSPVPGLGLPTLDFLLLQAPHATGILRRFCGRGRGSVAGDPPGDPHESSSAAAVLSLSGMETRIEPAMI